MEDKKNQASLRWTIGMIWAGYPAHRVMYTWILAKLTGHRELAAELEERFEAMTASFIDMKDTEASLRKVTAEKDRAMRDLAKKYRKACKIVKRAMPKETWHEFGIKVDDDKDK